jgi:hypothetical protein
MQILTLKKKEIELNEYIKRTALESDYKTLITEPTIIVDEDDGELKIVYDHLAQLDTSDIVAALKKIKYHEGQRARGLVSRSRIIGYRPRLEMRGDYCSSTSMATEFPAEHALVTEFALKLEEYYKTYHEEGYKKHKELTEGKVKAAYRIQGKSIFTSGIINKNNPLKYHYDTGNFKDVYSCMVVFKKDITGGYLSVPAYDVAFQLPNNAIFLFDGQSILHGVTPIKFDSEDAHRFSIVYYSLKRMWQCLEIDDELARIRKKKTSRERSRAKVPLTEEDKVLKEKNIAQLKTRFGKQ